MLFDDDIFAKLKKLKNELSKVSSDKIKPKKKKYTVEYRNLSNTPKVSETLRLKNIAKKTEEKNKKEIPIPHIIPPESSIKKELLDLCIGIDLGSSCSKVVIREHYIRDSAFIVDFQDLADKNNSYLLPTHLTRSDGKYFIPCCGINANIKNVKVNFINGKKDSFENLSRYLCCLITYSKEWFIKNYSKSDEFKNKEIIWSVNLGIPSAQFNEENDNKRFKDLLINAYKLHLTEHSINQDVSKVDLNIIPEIVAELKTYIDDDYPQGVYTAIDIGARTLDACCFKIHNKNDGYGEKYYFYSARVENQGAKKYEECFYSYINDPNIYENAGNDNTRNIIEEDIYSQKYIKKAKEIFFKECEKTLRKVIWSAKQKKDPYDKCWNTSLPVILCGGGSYLEGYKSFIKDFNTRVLTKEFNIPKGCKLVELPRVKFQNDEIDFDNKRVLVAYGLSFPFDEFENVKKIYKDCDVEDIVKTIKEVDLEDKYVSKDMC